MCCASFMIIYNISANIGLLTPRFLFQSACLVWSTSEIPKSDCSAGDSDKIVANYSHIHKSSWARNQKTDIWMNKNFKTHFLKRCQISKDHVRSSDLKWEKKKFWNKIAFCLYIILIFRISSVLKNKGKNRNQRKNHGKHHETNNFTHLKSRLLFSKSFISWMNETKLKAYTNLFVQINLT